MSILTEELIIRAKQKDKDAFGKLYQMFFGKIFRFVYFSLRQRELSEDLAQETFFRVWRTIESFSREKGSFQTFLFAVARNLIIDWHRKKKEVALDETYEIASLENIEEDAVKKEEQELVWRLLAKLKDFDKQIVVLRFFEELSFSDIAKIVSKKEGAVRVRLHRILKELKIYAGAEENK